MIGSTEWLQDMEEHYGGFHNGVFRNNTSKSKPLLDKVNPKGMTGGDRMGKTHHNYAKHYETHLSKFVKNRFENYTIVECGILKGTGLAIWSTLFPNATIIGLDIDLSNTKNNLEFLKSKGAFQSGVLELHEFDQFADNTNYIKDILKNKKIDIMIDDGFHSEFTILNTIDCVKPCLNNSFVYFVEDNKKVYKKIKQNMNNYNCVNYSRLSVIENE